MELTNNLVYSQGKKQAPLQQPKFGIADAHVSRLRAQVGGVLWEGQYVKRDAMMLNLIVAAYGVSEDNITGGPGGTSGPPGIVMHQSVLIDLKEVANVNDSAGLARCSAGNSRTVTCR
jgi:hypothetical protein